MERSRQDEGILTHLCTFPNRMMGIYRDLCGMCPEDTSLLNTEIGDSLVVRAIEQQKGVVVLGRQPFSGVSRLSRYLQCTTII